MKSGGAERCGCSYCRNFAAQRGTVYPKSFRVLLDQLGIDPEKEDEVYDFGSEGPLKGYGGWFYFAGELIEPGERMTDAGSGFPILLCRRQASTNSDGLRQECPCGRVLHKIALGVISEQT